MASATRGSERARMTSSGLNEMTTSVRSRRPASGRAAASRRATVSSMPMQSSGCPSTWMVLDPGASWTEDGSSTVGDGWGRRRSDRRRRLIPAAPMSGAPASGTPAPERPRRGGPRRGPRPRPPRRRAAAAHVAGRPRRPRRRPARQSCGSGSAPRRPGRSRPAAPPERGRPPDGRWRQPAPARLLPGRAGPSRPRSTISASPPTAPAISGRPEAIASKAERDVASSTFSEWTEGTSTMSARR